MKLIHKFPLLSTPGSIAIFAPRATKFLTVQLQGGTIVTWVQFEQDEPAVRHDIACVFTGTPHDDIGEYIGTASQYGLVMHYFAKCP